jgi:hypothetical protein
MRGRENEYLRPVPQLAVMAREQAAATYILGESDWQIADPAEDVRGCKGAVPPMRLIRILKKGVLS